MKKIFHTLVVLFASLTIISCSDDDKNDDIRVEYSELPADAKAFVQKHFVELSEQQVSYVEKDSDGTYDVVFKNGIEIEFYNDGIWKSIDMNANNNLPESVALLIPTNAISYISTKYPNVAIKEIEKKGPQSVTQAFKVELRGDLDVHFDHLGNVTNDKGVTDGGSQVISVDKLPATIQAFLKTYFEGQTPLVELEWDKYEITYNHKTKDEVEVEFLKSEVFKSIETEGSDEVIRKVINDMSSNISNYLTTNYSGYRVKSFSKLPTYFGGNLKDGYKLEVEQGKSEYEIYFDKDGNFIKKNID